MSTDNYIFRDATINDVPFLVDTIIEAEKSGTDKLAYCTIFGLSEEDTRKYIAEMLLEEVDGCELSISSFLIVEIDGQIAGAVSAWIDGIEGISSSILKGNLLSHVLPKSCIEKATALSPLIRYLHFDYIPGSIQLGSAQVLNQFRGRNLLVLLINKRIEKLLQSRPGTSEIYAQIFECNIPSIRTHEKLGFKQIMRKESPNEEIIHYLPYNSKVLFKKELNTK